MAISAQLVKELRERTGAGIMACKKALVETNGDMDKAVEVLREKGAATAEKKSGRIAAEGTISMYIADDKKAGAIVEVNCETDFVAENVQFTDFAKLIAKHITLSKANNVDELQNEKLCDSNGQTVKEATTALIAKLGENVKIRRFERYNAVDGAVTGYVHGGGRLAAMVNLKCDTANDTLFQVGKDLSMQIVAMNPLFVCEESVPHNEIAREEEIYRVQALNEGKPEKIVDKMVKGKIQKYYNQVCLLDQEWVKDTDIKIKKFLENKSKEIGSEITVLGFTRYEKGEGIEKKQENFAEEVEKQMNH